MNENIIESPSEEVSQFTGMVAEGSVFALKKRLVKEEDTLAAKARQDPKELGFEDVSNFLKACVRYEVANEQSLKLQKELSQKYSSRKTFEDALINTQIRDDSEQITNIDTTFSAENPVQMYEILEELPQSGYVYNYICKKLQKYSRDYNRESLGFKKDRAKYVLNGLLKGVDIIKHKTIDEIREDTKFLLFPYNTDTVRQIFKIDDLNMQELEHVHDVLNNIYEDTISGFIEQKTGFQLDTSVDRAASALHILCDIEEKMKSKES